MSGVDAAAFVAAGASLAVERALVDVLPVLRKASLRDQAGLAVTEALSHGLPVVCLDREGPIALAAEGGLPVRASLGMERVATGLAARLEESRRPEWHVRARRRAEELSFEARVAVVGEILAGICPVPTGSAWRDVSAVVQGVGQE